MVYGSKLKIVPEESTIMKPEPALTTKRKSDDFLPSIESILISTKWFGIPVSGGHRFLTLAILVTLLLLSIEVMAIWKLIRDVVELNTTDERGVTAHVSGAIFYANTLISLLLIWKLMKAWKRLSKYWLRIETEGLYLQPDKNIRMKLIIVTYFVIFCTCVEHGLSIVSAIELDCPPSEYFSKYIMSSHKFILNSYEYSLWVAVPIFIASIIATILWNFQNLIVILISMGLVSRYHRLNCFVKRFVVYETNPRRKDSATLLTRLQIWRRLRKAYVQQAELVRRVDKQLGALIILCVFSNIFFICLQLFLGLRMSDIDVIKRIYYYISISWIVIRASTVILSAAEVNSQSKRALASIYKCRGSGYNIEIKRLKYHIINDNVSLTGLGMFVMNRQILLEVVAAIIKYELILINLETNGYSTLAKK